ncbi:unnamed protein product [Eretmochelys imbricata]
MFLVALFPSPSYLCTLYPRPHRVTGSPGQPPPGLAKMAIYKARVRRLADGVSCDCGAYFQISVHSRIRAEFLWAASTDSLDAFEEQWALSGVLCSVSLSGSLHLTV